MLCGEDGAGVLVPPLLIWRKKNYGIPVVKCRRCRTLAAHDLQRALANVARQDADCGGLMDVNVYGAAARPEFTVARGTRGA